MTIEITPRRVLAMIGAMIILFFAGYGVGNLSAKAYAAFFASAPAQPANVLA